MQPKQINCLFAEHEMKKYVVLTTSGQIGFAHLNELTAYLDRTVGKENYLLKFRYADE